MLSKYTADVILDFHPIFKGLSWVAAARSSDEERAALCLVKIEKGDRVWELVATDGRRMHLHTFDPGLFEDDIDMPEPGLYEVVARTAKLIVISEADVTKYPEWRKVFTRLRPKHRATLCPKTIAKLGIDTGKLLATDFTLDALGYGHGRAKKEAVFVEYACGDGPFYLKHDLGEAIVMPLHQRDEDGDESETEEPHTPEMEGLVEDEVPSDQ